jgi:(R,R)-butanediol dehydrogenase/meso-butanediol dehydrogenase/diacetyl reductase
MKAVRLYGTNDLRLEDVDWPPPPAAGEVRLRVEAAGICGSDLHNFKTGQWISRVPVTPGHELSGVVLDVGPGVTTLKAGDHVVTDSRYWCGECAPCVEGRRHLCERLGFVGEVCDGGFAEQTTLPARLLHKVNPDVDARVAAMAEPIAVALHAIRRLRAQPGDPILVIGCGTIGGLAALLLTRTHDGIVLVADRNEERKSLVAKVTGATAVDLDTAALANGAKGKPVRHAIEATGSVAALRAGIACLASGSVIALVGLFHERFDLDPNWLVEKEAALIGCHAFDDELHEAVSLLPSFGQLLLALLDDEIALDAVPAAYTRLTAGKARGLKTLVRPAMDLSEDSANSVARAQGSRMSAI